ncbi:MAG: hypothetical protein R2713_20025 [Ilumatobacteraceae bacterium]
MAGTAAIEPRLAELAQRLDEVAELAAAPVAPDDELASRLDQLSRSAETVDLLQRQVGQINARMSTQADLADQLTALSDRVGLLQQRNVDSDQINQRLDELTASGSTTELAERMALLAQRVAAAEDATRQAADAEARLQAQLASIDERINATADQASQVGNIHERITQLDERINATADQASQVDSIHERITQLDERINATADQVSQVGDLDDRINTLVSSAPATGSLESRLADLDHRLNEQSSMADRLADLDARISALGAQGTDVADLRHALELRTADLAGLAS